LIHSLRFHRIKHSSNQTLILLKISRSRTFNVKIRSAWKMYLFIFIYNVQSSSTHSGAYEDMLSVSSPSFRNPAMPPKQSLGYQSTGFSQGSAGLGSIGSGIQSYGHQIGAQQSGGMFGQQQQQQGSMNYQNTGVSSYMSNGGNSPFSSTAGPTLNINQQSSTFYS
jgi:hypothetical protein